ncbi:hypothetical protein PGB90_002685 [Kerria lacca]
MIGKSDCFSEVHKLKISKRTEGDGMENKDIKIQDSDLGVSKELQIGMNYNSFVKQASVPSAHLPGKVIKSNDEKHTSLIVKFSKEPKFVPYEPYKAATSPIIKNINEKDKCIKFLKNANLNVHNLIKMENLNVSTEMKPCHLIAEINAITENENVYKNGKEKKDLLNELEELKKKNSKLENQVKFQTQINGEIKKLLIAAVGEDMETRVQLLTEDKLYLAKQLLNTAKTLSTHQEQIEWLVGQSEVWRSKFLASSILVENLAKCKAKLCQKVSECENVLRHLLEDNDKLRQNVFKTFVNLSTLHEKFDLNTIADDTRVQVVSSNLINLCFLNQHLSELLLLQLLHENINKKKIDFDILNSMTPAEKKAEEVLAQPVIPCESSDIVCSAVMTGAALALSSTAPHCCHCTGTVKTI